MSSRMYSSGFTLIELMITIAIVAILTALALPSFQNFIRRNAVASEVNNLIGSLQTARTLALSGNFAAGVCVSKAIGIACTGATATRYDTGTAIFTRPNNAVGNEVVQSYVEERSGNLVQVVPSLNGAGRITFDRLGRVRDLPPAVGGIELRACYAGTNTPNVQGVSVFVARSGRITSLRLAAADNCTPANARSSY